MKIIDLLVKMANGELETFYKFKYRNKIVNMGYLIDNYLFLEILNDEVEIIKETPIISKLYINNELQYNLEEKKIPEKLGDYSLDKKGKYPIRTTIYEGILKDKINEIIDYLKSKGE